MNDNQFCFIICTNNELLMGECIEYISRLYVPEGYTIDLLTITDAKSMTSGNNEGMRASDAKYKIYMHQDVFITNRYFLFDLLGIFGSDQRIGLIGMVGYQKIADDAVMWHEERFGANPMYGTGRYSSSDFEGYRYSAKDGVIDVKVCDGLMLVTAYDIEWDEEFDGWDFYDASQCLRFTNSGYRVVVPNQRIPWFVHDDGLYLSVWNYNKYRHLFIDKYLNCDAGEKIAVITCVNNERCYEEFRWYLNRVSVPEGYSLEIVPVRGAGDMTSGYNKAMHSSNAKYKIYVHQDVFFTDSAYIRDVIECFIKNPQIGLIGALGTDRLPEDAVLWSAWNKGFITGFTGRSTVELDASSEKEICDDIKAVDGMFIATQYDIEWREDLGLGWDFYDISQSLEFIKAGYKVAVLNNGRSSMLHDCGCSKLSSYEHGREIMLREYPDFFGVSFAKKNYAELSAAAAEIAGLEINLYDSGLYSQLVMVDEEVRKNNSIVFNTDVSIIQSLCLLYNSDRENCEKSVFFNGTCSYDEIKNIYNELRYLIRRAACFDDGDAVHKLEEMTVQYGISEKEKRTLYSFFLTQNA